MLFDFFWYLTVSAVEAWWTTFTWMNSICAIFVMPVVWIVLVLNVVVWLWNRRRLFMQNVLGYPQKFSLGTLYTAEARATGAAGPRPPFVVITGGARGLGQQLVRKFVKLNYEVEVWDIAVKDCLPEDALQHSRVRYVFVNVGDRLSVKAAANKLIQMRHIPDILVLNAGIVTGKRIGAGMDMEKTQNLFQVNVLQLFYVMNSLMLPMVGLKDPGGPEFPVLSFDEPSWSRRVVIIGDASGFNGYAHLSDYNCSKAAANLFAEALSAEIRLSEGFRDVQVTLVTPYRMDTGMFDGAKDLKYLQVLNNEEVANDILYGIKIEQDTIVLPYWLILSHAVRAVIPGRLVPWIDWFFGASESGKNLGNSATVRMKKFAQKSGSRKERKEER